MPIYSWWIGYCAGTVMEYLLDWSQDLESKIDNNAFLSWAQQVNLPSQTWTKATCMQYFMLLPRWGLEHLGQMGFRTSGYKCMPHIINNIAIHCINQFHHKSTKYDILFINTEAGLCFWYYLLSYRADNLSHFLFIIYLFDISSSFNMKTFVCFVVMVVCVCLQNADAMRGRIP